MSQKLITHSGSGLVVSLDDVIANTSIVAEIETGRYEAEELYAACRLISSEDRVLELGAGIGFISAGIMRHVQPSFYAAVEADKRLLSHIRATHVQNGIDGVEIIHGAFTTEEEALRRGSVTFRLHREFWRSGIGQTQPGSIESVSVPTYDASDYIAANAISVLIADIEGSELDLLRNLQVSGLRKVLLELHPQHIGKSGVRDVFCWLMDAGFTYSTQFSNGAVVCFERSSFVSHKTVSRSIHSGHFDLKTK